MGGPVAGDTAPGSVAELPDPADIARPWQESYPPGVPPSYAYPDVPLTRFVDDAARDFPGTIATSFHGATADYTELVELVDRCAAGLAGLGVGPGSHVGLRLDPSPALPVVVFGLWRLGAVAVPIPAGTTGSELVDALAGCEVAVVETTALADLADVRSRIPTLRTVVATGPHEWLPRLRARWFRLVGRRRGAYRPVTGSDDAHRLRDLLEDAEPTGGHPSVPSGHPALRAPTRSGGTITLTHGQLLAAAFQARLWVPDIQAGKERVLVAEPIHTPHELVCSVLAPVLAAATLHLVRDVGADDVIETIDQARVTLLTARAPLLEGLATGGSRADLTTLRVVFSTGTLDVETAARLEAGSGARVRATYGRADAPFVLANPVYGRAERATMGLPVTDTAAIVIGDDGRPAPPGEPGRLLIAGPQVAGEPGWRTTDARVVMTEQGAFRRVGPA